MRRPLKTTAILAACIAPPFVVWKHQRAFVVLKCVGIALLLLVFREQIEKSEAELKSQTNFIAFSKIDKAQAWSTGEGTKVAVCDWLFDLRGGEASGKYTNAVSMIPGEPVGDDEPWHGEWMSETIHQTAPACKIIPIRARTEADDYQQYLIKGIRFAADQGAVAVTSSMGPLTWTPELEQAVDYAEARGTLFINVHPVKNSSRGHGGLDGKILYTGLISVPWHPALPEPRRHIYVWPYSLAATYKDGWGYSSGPPVVAGVVALMKSANPALTPREVKDIIIQTASTTHGFHVLDAQAAVQEAVRRKKPTP